MMHNLSFSSLTFVLHTSHQVYWFKDGKQILRKNVHYKKIREGDGTCALHIESTTSDDDGNYTVMAANPQVIHTQLPVPVVSSFLRTANLSCYLLTIRDESAAQVI